MFMSLTYLNGSKSVQQGWKTTLPPQTSCGLGPAFQSSTHSKYFKSIFKLKGWGQIEERTCVGDSGTALLIITPSTPYPESHRDTWARDQLGTEDNTGICVWGRDPEKIK